MRSLLIAFLAIAFSATPAVAASVPNDDIGQATQITGLPFSDTVDLAAATEAAGDLDCSGLADTHTVWYTITPQSDMRLGLRTQPTQAGVEVSTSVASGTPGALTFIQCSFSSTQAFDAKAGTTYYIQLATAGDAAGGPVSFSVEQVQPLSVSLTLRRTGQISDSGVVTVGGTLRCSRTLAPGSEVVVQGTLVQGDAEGWLVPVHFTNGCSTSPMRWETTVQLLSSAGFTRGPAQLAATGFACDEFICAEPKTQQATIRLK
jgi:hypothetical protein